jgi:chromosome segregation ATPase
MSAYSDGLTVLRKVVEDERNWRSGMGQIETLLNAAEAAEKALAEHENRKATLAANIERLEREGKQYENSVNEVKAKLNGFAADLAEREASAQSRLTAINDELTAKQAMLTEANASLSRIAALGASVSSGASAR